MYPKGNKNEDGDGQVSLYVQIDNSTLLNSPKEVDPEIKFFIYNQKEDVDMKRIKSKSKDMKNLVDHGQEIMDRKSWTGKHGHEIMDRKSWTGNHGQEN